MARVSWPSFASLKPVEWRSMWGWIGMPSPAASPARAMSLRKVAAVIGARRSETKTWAVSAPPEFSGVWAYTPR